ncbi:MAG: methyltransferase domain-containing protein [Deltaproteobacteria bacterium]|nr:methyltransferase domain-containing protein [Deltaproteobacteria bacterium]
MALPFGNAMFERFASAYDLLTGHEHWRAHIRRLLALVEVVPPGGRALDLGCGPGESSFELARALGPDVEIVGVDIAEAMIHRARAHHADRHPGLRSVRFEQKDGTDLGFEPNSFDLVVCHSFLYLVPDREAVLREVARVLKPGGQIALMEPQAGAPVLGAAIGALSKADELFRTPLASVRFVASMVSWRIVVGVSGGLTAELVERLLRAAAFEEIRVSPALGGLGLHIRAKKAR